MQPTKMANVTFNHYVSLPFKRSIHGLVIFRRLSKQLSFTDGGLSDYLPGPVKDLDQTGPLTAGNPSTITRV